MYSFLKAFLVLMKLVRIYLNILKLKIIIIAFRTTSNQFQHEVCQTIKDQMIS